MVVVKEFDGCRIYLRNGDWKIVIQGSANGAGGGEATVIPFTEDEAMSIARSIKW
ncbi:hypothetical protein [Paenibacillus sp. GCM10012306]|uniref:hypothetical protein n=1 Tax=Paenibacillus sp. GCM10012306 TaxID=3317342 RepID=UPI0036D264A9